MTQDDGSPGSQDLTRQQMEQFVQLSTMHQRRVFQYILALVSRLHDAQDILQQTNLTLWRKFAQFETGSNFYAWAARIAHFEVLKYRDSLAGKAVSLDHDVMDQIAAEAVEYSGEIDAGQTALMTCLDKLSPADRELVTQRYAMGVAGKELAEKLNRPFNSVYKSLGRIRQALLECIARTLRLTDPAGGAL